MTIAALEGSPRRPDDGDGDCERAALWLCALDAEALPRGVSPRAWLALGLALAASLVSSPALAARARERAARRLDDVPSAIGGPDTAGDAFVTALAFAVAARRADGVTARWIGARTAAAAPARAALARRLIGEPVDSPAVPRWGDAVERTLLAGSAQEAADLADAIEALGIAELPEPDRPRLAAAVAARAFAELRGHRGFALGTSLLRVHAAHGRDRIGTEYALAYLRRQQRLDGAFGHLPPHSPQAGDIRAAFHLPRTVLALWTIHDATAPAGLLRGTVEDAGRAR